MNREKKRIIVWVILILALCVMVFSGYKLWETQRIYAEGDQSYEELSGLVRKALDVSLDGSQEAQVNIPALSIDFAALKAVGEDAVAWLYCPDTVIDYPVMEASDYDWYLHHLPDGKTNANGTLFLDYNNPSDFSGRLNIIYGHNMKSGKMFGTLVEYKKQAYFDEHPYLYLYTADTGNYRIDLLYGCVVDAGAWRDRAFMYEANLTPLLSYAAHNTTFESAAGYTEDDRFVVLSTCSYEFDDARYVIVGVLRPE